MAENSKIEWCDHTVNLWWGCAKVHTGCKNCYAEHLSDTRYKNNLWGENTGRKMIKSAFKNLDKFQRDAEKDNKKVKVFVGSMMDIFEDEKILIEETEKYRTTFDLVYELFSRIINGHYENIVFLFLTKRPGNIDLIVDERIRYNKNCWFGTSVSDTKTLLYAVALQRQDIKNRFLSIEPQVGAIISLDVKGIHWVIQGGESGHKKRPFNPNWARHIRNICKAVRVPYFFKQIDKVQPIPEDLQIRQFPKSMQ